MTERQTTPRKRLYTANMVLAGIVAGFVFALSLYSCASGPASAAASARDTSPGTNAARGEANPAALQGARDLQDTFRYVVDKTLDTVVKVDVVEIVNQDTPRSNNPFDFFFGNPDTPSDPEQQFRNEGLGSGVIVRRQANTYYILTNAHVAGHADQIEVTLADERQFPGTLVGADTRLDLALVSFQSADDIPVAAIGDSSSLRVGDWVVAIGSPYGLQSTVTVGIVSALNRRGGPDGNISDFIQTDAAINRGNSGGPLMNLDGEVVGINTWITSQTGGSIGLGFAIPINNATKAIDDFIAKGKIVYGWLGVQISDVGADLAGDLELPDRKGAIVRSVFQGSPADKGGLMPGDFVTRLNNRRVTNSDELNIAIGNLPVGQKAEFELYRGGRQISVTATIEERLAEASIQNLNQRLWPGLTILPLTSEIRQEAGISGTRDGVLVLSVEARTPAAIAGLRPADVITALDGAPIASGLEFYKQLNDSRKRDLPITIQRDGVDRVLRLTKP